MAIEFGPKDRYRTYGVPSLDIPFADRKSLVDIISGNNLITFTRSTTGTYVGSDGLIKTAAVNEPRFDHDPLTGESLGLLVEEARTNLVTGIAQVSQYTSNVTTSIVSDVTNPSGDTSNVLKVQCTATTGGHGCLGGSFSGTGWASVFVKRGNYRYVGIENRSNIGGGYLQATFDFDTETFSYRSGTFQKFPNGWYRIFVNITWDGNAPAFGLVLAASSSYFGWTATGTEYAYFWGPQIEMNSFPTSYIPTSGSAVTRAADIVSITGTNFSSWYNQSEGTWLVRWTNTSRTGSFLGVLSVGGDNTPRFLSNTIVGYLDVSSFTASNQNVTAAYAFNSTGESRVLGGSVLGTTSSPISGNESSVNIGTGGASSPANYMLNQPIKRLTYYQTRLPNATLQGLTST